MTAWSLSLSCALDFVEVFTARTNAPRKARSITYTSSCDKQVKLLYVADPFERRQPREVHPAALILTGLLLYD